MPLPAAGQRGPRRGPRGGRRGRPRLRRVRQAPPRRRGVRGARGQAPHNRPGGGRQVRRRPPREPRAEAHGRRGHGGLHGRSAEGGAGRQVPGARLEGRGRGRRLRLRRLLRGRHRRERLLHRRGVLPPDVPQVQPAGLRRLRVRRAPTRSPSLPTYIRSAYARP